MDLIDELGIKALDNLKVSFIRSGIAKGLSANKILNRLKLSPLGGMQRSNFLKVVRHIKRIKQTRPYVDSVNLGKKIDFSRLAPSEYGHEKKYNFVVKLKGISKMTGENAEEWMTISTDREITKADAIFEAGVFFGSGKYGLQEDSISAMVDEVFLGTNYYE